MSDSDKLRTQQKINIIQTERLTDALINGSQASAIADAQIMKNRQLSSDVDTLEMANINLRKHNKNLQEEIETIKLQLADWIVSQKSFKEIAIKYGKKSGLNRDEIVKEGLATEIKVLENETEFDNNVSASPLANRFRDQLIGNIKNNTNAQ